ncbi:MAG: histidine kinase [Arachnia sp.]
MPPLSRTQRWWMAALIVLMPVMLFVSWGLQLEEHLPEPLNTVLMLLDPILGIVALVLLPRVLSRDTDAEPAADAHRERRALVFGVVVIACSGIAGSAILPAAAAVISLAGRRRRGWVLAAAASFLVTATLSAISWGDPLPWHEALIASVLLDAVLILVGLYRGGRRELLRSLRHEADAARRGQEAREAQARQEERTEIAREMHDTVSHRLALVALHAGALEFRDDLTPEQMREAAAVIRRGAQEAADELRATLHVLRADASDTRPAPTLDSLRTLVDDVRAAGGSVAFALEAPEGAPPPPTVLAHVYRVVQEGLTNAVKHAPGQEADVVVRVAPAEGVQVTISNPLPPNSAPGQGARVGLVGLRERVTLAGGRLDAGPRGERFVLEAWVPWSH